MRFIRSPGSIGVAIARLFGLGLLILLVLLRIGDPLFVSNFRNQSFDILQRLHPRPYVKQPVVVVDIDEKSLEQVGQWPWPRSEVARLVDRLTAMGAIAIGFDVVFAEPDRLSPDRVAEDNATLPADIEAGLMALPSNEDLLADAIRRSRVVVGETSVRQGESSEPNADGAAGQDIPEIPHAALGGDPTPYLLQFPRLVQNLKVISDAAAGHGMFTVEPDADGIFRRVPLVMLVESKIRLGLSAEILRIATGGQAFATRTDGAGLSGIVVGGVLVPTDGNGKVWPWFNGSLRERYVSAGSVLSGAAPASSIAGHMVLVGTSAVGLEDFRATPVAAFMPGVEIHAQIIENILTQQFLSRPNYAIGMEIVLVILFGLFIIWLVPKIGAVYAFFAAASVLGMSHSVRSGRSTPAACSSTRHFRQARWLRFSSSWPAPGVAVGTDTLTINTPAGTEFLAGARPSGGSIPGLLQGQVDDIQVYDRALTPEEIQSIHHNVLDNDTDIDSSDSMSVTGVAPGTPAGDVSGQVGLAVAGVYGALTLDADGVWTYTRDDNDPDTQQLSEGEAATDVFTYTMADAHGATSTTTLSIAIHGINDAPVISSLHQVTVDFDEIAAAGGGVQNIADEYVVGDFKFVGYTPGGDSVGQNALGTMGSDTAPSSYPGSASLLNRFSSGYTEFSRIDGSPFDLSSIDLSEINDSQLTGTFTITGTTSTGSTVVETVTKDGTFGFQTVELTGFEDLVTVRIDGQGYHIDNIIADVVTGGEATGEVFEITDGQARREYGDAQHDGHARLHGC